MPCHEKTDAEKHGASEDGDKKTRPIDPTVCSTFIVPFRVPNDTSDQQRILTFHAQNNQPPLPPPPPAFDTDTDGKSNL